MSMSKYRVVFEINPYQGRGAENIFPGEIEAAFSDYLDERGIIYKQKNGKVCLKGEYDYAIVKLALDFDGGCRYSTEIEKKDKETGEWHKINIEEFIKAGKVSLLK